jgi:hypothetical protein
MQWSQLKKRIESLFFDAVKGRMALRTTRYHKAHDQMGRGWITFDGREVISMCSFAAGNALWDEASRLRRQRGCTDWRDPEQAVGYRAAYAEAEENVHAMGVFARPEFTEALFNYLNLSIEKILNSPDPIIRAIGMLDQRVGLRRLSAMDVEHEHPLVQRFHELRCDTEMRPSNPVPSAS